MYNAMEINGVKTVGNNSWCGNGFGDHRALPKILRQRGNEVGEQGGESLDAGRI